MCTVELACPAAIWLVIEIAWLIGIAKPAVASDWSGAKPELLAAVSMPMTWADELTSGPPESPSWIGALVWIMPCSVSSVLAPLSVA